MNWIQKQIAGACGIDRFINPIHFERYSSRFIDAHADYSDFSEDLTKLTEVFNSPAALKVFQLCCDMMSMAKVYVYKNDVEQKNNPLLDLLKNPNPMQTRNQWLWDFMFWKMIGNAYLYSDNNIADEDNKLYWLDTCKMVMPEEIKNKRDFLFLSEKSVRDIKETYIRYNYSNGEYKEIRWGRIDHITDLSNGTGNWFRGRSKIDALYKIVCNSNAAIDSKNINVRYAGKFMVAGQADPNNATHQIMGVEEKESIEQKMNGHKNVHAVKSMIDIKRFVEDASLIERLDESYMSDYFKIGSLYNIPKDVLEAYNNGSTYENQEKARGAFVSYCLQPSADILAKSLDTRFNIDGEVVFDWEHLPFMQVFAKERAETEFKKTQSLINLIKAGLPIEDINKMLDLKLTSVDYEGVKGNSNQAGAGEGSN